MVPATSVAKDAKPHPADPTYVAEHGSRSAEVISLPSVEPAANLKDLPDVFSRIRLGYALPDVDDPSIDRQVKFFVGKPDFLDRTFGRGERYLYFVTRELEARHMPMELAFLPVIESAYNPYAYSRARAAGIWQFIAPTATRHQVRVNWWQDGRRDIVDSTRAALDYLEELNRMFNGDWLLAIAAYNCGEQAVLRAVQRNAARGLPTDFWNLKLPTETRGYVPELLAMARIVAHPENYGLEFAPIANAPYFARVEVGGQIDLRVAAAILGISDEELHALNPAFNRWATDPEGPHSLLVPAAQATAFAEAIASLPPEQRMPLERYRLEPKETLAKIAKRRNLTVAALQALNGNPNLVANPGDEIWLPASTVTAPLRAGLIIEGENSPKAGRRLAHDRHVVRRGETLASIARKNHLDVEELARLNGLAPKAHLKPGNKLILVVEERQAAARAQRNADNKVADARSSNDHPRTEPDKSAPASGGKAAATASKKHGKGAGAATVASTREIRYHVRHGDTLYAITRKFQVTLAQLKQWNRLDGGLHAGQELVLHVAADRDFGG
jgi:membrane-bound lytic murein transglycosylase D